MASAVVVNSKITGFNNRPALLAGDLNDTIDSPALKELLKHWQPTSTQIQPTIPVEHPNRQIDFILMHPSNRWKIIESKVLPETVASDHRAIMAVLQLQTAVSNTP